MTSRESKLQVLDLFSGIGGFALGLEAAGMETVAFCEQNPHARAVLKHHWPDLPAYEDVPIYDDITTLTAERLRADGLSIDVMCGGFPCQDISLSGSGAGLAGARSGLWFEYLRLIEEVGPRWVIIENVAALRGRGLGEVLGGLAQIGYDAEWHCIPASAVGAPHRRDRVWIIAYPNCDAGDERRAYDTDADRGSISEDVADAYSVTEREPSVVEAPAILRNRDARVDAGRCGELLADAFKPRLEILLNRDEREQPSAIGAHTWTFEPDVCRVAYGVSSRVDRITRLGNAVVPQIPEAIGRAILAYEDAEQAQ